MIVSWFILMYWVFILQSVEALLKIDEGKEEEEKLLQVEEEQFQRGSIKGRIYCEYIKAGAGPLMFISMLIFTIVSQTIFNGSDIFLTLWLVAIKCDFHPISQLMFGTPFQDQQKSTGRRRRTGTKQGHHLLFSVNSGLIRQHHPPVDHLLCHLHACLGSTAQQNFLPSTTCTSGLL